MQKTLIAGYANAWTCQLVAIVAWGLPLVTVIVRDHDGCAPLNADL